MLIDIKPTPCKRGVTPLAGENELMDHNSLAKDTGHRTTPQTIRWVMQPGQQDVLAIDPLAQDRDGAVPDENEVITRPFLIDPRSGQPVRARVVQRLEWHHERAPTFVVVVAREP